MFAYRPALDGVRALAVAAVLLFHGGVTALGGGFLGVDAFFVLSGYLITSLLLTERQRYGRIRLRSFWVRRARRLLPALVAVLLVVVVAFRVLLDPAELSLLRLDALAALGYVANWHMIYRGDDYFTQTAAPSPLQHTWSLGIEEQFYLAWPLIVVALLAIGLRRPYRWLLALCFGGAAASAVAAAMLYDPLDVNRAYFGTDTRAQALLVGCGLAVLLHRPRGERTREVAAVAGVAGVGVVAWTWSHTSGADAWLFHGGLTLHAVAVAAVIAYAVLSPDDPVGRLLALSPLVWLGRISYGVYLWHWPLFLLLNADRTGLVGTPLLALRLTVTLTVAAASYVLIEQPVRTGRWPSRARPAFAAATAIAIVGTTGAFVVTGTEPRTVGAAAPIVALPSTPATSPGSRPPPIARAGRKPGTEPRITFFGDSVAWSLGTYLPPHPGLTITVRAIQGCGIARLPDIIQQDEGHTNYPACPTWDTRWRRSVNSDDPDVAVILLDRWELMDRKVGDVYRHVGEPEYDFYLSRELELAVSIVSSHGARVVLLTAPYTRRHERRDGSLYDEDRPERVDAWNRLLYAQAGRSPETVTIIDLNRRVCPDGEFTWSIDGLRIRSDGLHFTPAGVQRWIAPWLLPQLAALATT